MTENRFQSTLGSSDECLCHNVRVRAIEIVARDGSGYVEVHLPVEAYGGIVGYSHLQVAFIRVQK